MSNTELRGIILVLLLLLSSAHLLGHAFVRLRQPRVVGEILAGILVGPCVLGQLVPQVTAAFSNGAAVRPVLEFVYQLGLMLLMFISGTETRHLFARQDRRSTAWLLAFGTGLPFLVFLLLSRWLPVSRLIGSAGQKTALLLVTGIAVAVTSIPVISKIFHDLAILHTRFASLVLGVAVIEDIALWAVLAVATALAAAGSMAPREIALHVAVTLLYLIAGLLLLPPLLHRITRARFNVLAHASPVGYAIAVLLAFALIAAVVDVSLVFAAFLAGFALTGAGSPREAIRLGTAMARPATDPGTLDSISRFSFAFFIPVYFAMVGYRLDLGRTFSLTLLLGTLAGACIVKLLAVGLGAKLAGFASLDILNIAITMNARGGPGIVLASVAYDAHIINATFYTTLVLLAVLSSQAAGAWLHYVLGRGWPLLSGQASATIAEPEALLPKAA